MYYFIYLLHVPLHCVILYVYDQLVSTTLNASIPLFHQHLLFIVYKSPLGLGFVSFSIKIEFVNLKKVFVIFLYQFRLACWPHVCFQDDCCYVISFFP